MASISIHLHWLKGEGENSTAGLLTYQDLPVPRVGEFFDLRDDGVDPSGTFKVVQVHYSFDSRHELESIWVQLEHTPEDALDYREDLKKM